MKIYSCLVNFRMVPCEDDHICKKQNLYNVTDVLISYLHVLYFILFFSSPLLTLLFSFVTDDTEHIHFVYCKVVCHKHVIS